MPATNYVLNIGILKVFYEYQGKASIQIFLFIYNMLSVISSGWRIKVPYGGGDIHL